MLKISNFVKKFNNRLILDHVSLTVPQGSIALLLGESGVGKSTLLRALNNLEQLDSGTVTLNGQELDLTTVNKTHTIGMVFQHFNLFDHLTVEQNVTLALEKVAGKSIHEAKKIAHETLEKYGLAEKASLPISKLSGGQKQRLALARLIALKPQVICLDEPTSALDPLLTNFVADNIQQLANDGYTVLVATHDVAIIERLNCSIYLMKDGKIIEATTAHDLRKNPEHYPAIHQFIKGS